MYLKIDFRVDFMGSDLKSVDYVRYYIDELTHFSPSISYIHRYRNTVVCMINTYNFYFVI